MAATMSSGVEWLACTDARRGYRLVADRLTTVDRSAGPAGRPWGGTFRAAPAAGGLRERCASPAVTA